MPTALDCNLVIRDEQALPSSDWIGPGNYKLKWRTLGKHCFDVEF